MASTSPVRILTSPVRSISSLMSWNSKRVSPKVSIRRSAVAADSEAFRVSKVWTGKTVRAFHGEISQAWAESGLPTLETPYQRILMEDFLAAALAAGRHDLFYNIAGQAGGLLKARRPARDIMTDLVDGAVHEIRRLQRDVRISLA